MVLQNFGIIVIRREATFGLNYAGTQSFLPLAQTLEFGFFLN